MHVAVLGAGIMGSSTALLLARRGVRVTLFDKSEVPCDGASRWNEGKIHLGYLYGGDPTLATARAVLPGGLRFKRLTEELIGCSLDGRVTPASDVYLVHRRSVVDADSAGRYFRAVNEMVRHHCDASGYLVDASTTGIEKLTPQQLAAEYDVATVVAGFRVPEHSVTTQWLADRMVDAVMATTIDLRLGTRILGMRRTSPTDPLSVETEHGVDGPFDIVVNALWEGRLRVDASTGIAAPPQYSHRYRLALFVQTRSPVELSSAVVATGPFGDVKNYTGTEFYVSWYPAGLIVEAEGIDPPSLPDLTRARRDRVATETFARLGDIIPSVADVDAMADLVTVAGGWVSAAGSGPLADPASTLHRRVAVGVTRTGNYITVDTGKYSIAPWLAEKIVDSLLA